MQQKKSEIHKWNVTIQVPKNAAEVRYESIKCENFRAAHSWQEVFVL